MSASVWVDWHRSLPRNRRQFHQSNSVAVPLGNRAGRLDRQPGFAPTPEARQRQKSDRLQPRSDGGEFPVAANEAGQAEWQGVAPVRAGQTPTPTYRLYCRPELIRRIARQFESGHQPLGGIAVRVSRAAFELLDTVHAQSGTFREGLLRQPTRHTVMSQQCAESGCLIDWHPEAPAPSSPCSGVQPA
jgi:hypothetical protein